MIWRHFDDPNEFEAARLDGTSGLFRRHSQFGPWATWFMTHTEHRVAQFAVPHNTGFQCG
jgi:hypothetical protein